MFPNYALDTKYLRSLLTVANNPLKVFTTPGGGPGSGHLGLLCGSSGWDGTGISVTQLGGRHPD